MTESEAVKSRLQIKKEMQLHDMRLTYWPSGAERRNTESIMRWKHKKGKVSKISGHQSSKGPHQMPNGPRLDQWIRKKNLRLLFDALKNIWRKKSYKILYNNNNIYNSNDSYQESIRNNSWNSSFCSIPLPLNMQNLSNNTLIIHYSQSKFTSLSFRS